MRATILLLILFISLPAAAAGEDKDAFLSNKRIGGGVNLGNALEAPQEGKWGVRLEESYFKLIAEEFSVNNGMLTPKMSLKRNVVMKLYGEEIEALHTR